MMQPANVLVIDDDSHLRKFLARDLARAGFSTVAAEGGKTAIALLRERTFDVVVCDLNMPDVDGFAVLQFSSSLNPPPPFIMLTGYGSVSVAVDAMKHGATDFLEKPVSPDVLRAAIRANLARGKSAKGRRLGSGQTGLAGSDLWLATFLESLGRIAQTDATVLIEGETGTGKSAVAREIWRRSRRAKAPFVDLNCAAIPATLIENELFGHVEGAFTGAVGQSGKVEQADGGTLFLDEVGELRSDLQAKLLRLLQERTFSRIGSPKEQHANVRFIAATNRKLLEEVEGGTFRRDLYYRLNVVSFTIPPLRERRADVPVLIDHFVKQACDRLETSSRPTFSDAALSALQAYEWPGNVRELENLVERLTIMHPAEVTIEPEHLGQRISWFQNDGAVEVESAPPAIQTSDLAPRSDSQPNLASLDQEGLGLNDAVRNYEISLIRAALKKSSGNRSAAARMLRMKRTTLVEKLKKYDGLMTSD